MRISDILSKDSIETNMQAHDKATLLKNMMELAGKSGKIIDSEEALKEIFEREKIMSTGVGKGIALPHAKTNAVEDSTGAMAILSEPVDFDSLDSKPVSLIFMLLGRENNVGNHLRLLSKVSRLMNNDTIRERIIKAETPERVLQIFNEIEDSE